MRQPSGCFFSQPGQKDHDFFLFLRVLGKMGTQSAQFIVSPTGRETVQPFIEKLFSHSALTVVDPPKYRIHIQVFPSEVVYCEKVLTFFPAELGVGNNITQLLVPFRDSAKAFQRFFPDAAIGGNF